MDFQRTVQSKASKEIDKTPVLFQFAAPEGETPKNIRFSAVHKTPMGDVRINGVATVGGNTNWIVENVADISTVGSFLQKIETELRSIIDAGV